MSANSASDLQRIYSARFAGSHAYRAKVWNILVSHFFQKYVNPNDVVLDLGCGYGEFINTVHSRKKYALDLNPDAQKYLAAEVNLIEQDCAARWPFEEQALDVVFTSNFFEHLPDKGTLGRTLDEIFRCLTPGGRLVAMGPNIKHLPGKYWDFWDHHLPLSEISLGEGLSSRGFEITKCVGKFLPYTMVSQREYPGALLKLYLRFPFTWQIFGKQFLLVAQKPR